MDLLENLTEADRRRLYVAGFTDTPDAAAPARGILVGLVLGVASWAALVAGLILA